MLRWSLLGAAYLLGSLPFALLLVRMAGGGDVREIGSGNVGTTNAARAAGWKVAAFVLVLDIGKGLLAIELMRLVTYNPAWVTAAGVAAVVGHCYPVWLRFAGGKGVATAAGAFALIAPLALLAAAAAWVATLALGRWVALASLVAAAVLPMAVLLIHRPPGVVVVLSVVAALVVITRHRQNLERIVRGEEPRVGKGRGL